MPVMRKSFGVKVASWLGVAVLVVCTVPIRAQSTTSGGAARSTSVTPALAYVGSAACVECHAEAGKAWRGSQHAQAMQPATGETVLGRFDGRTLRHGKSRTRFFQRDGRFRVITEGADNRPQDMEVTHTFGVYPLQQYLVSLPDGRKQALGVAWDSRSRNNGGGRWFHIFPKDGTRPGHPQHWAGIDQNWNYQCADCHSTNLRKGYDAKSDRFATTWSEMNVGCEACHGPGSAHLAWAAKPAAERPALANLGLTAALTERGGVAWIDAATPGVAKGTRVRSQPRSGNVEIEVCARCHSRRGQIGDEHRAGDALFDAFRPALIEPGLYYPDGQQRDEVYNYGSFLQSRMHVAGVTCSDCHEPHGSKLRVSGNAICAKCHKATLYGAAAHHHHQPESAGAQCAACHMPTTTYMGVDPRHDHSLRIPRPDRTLTLGTPNPCSQCHDKKPAKWAADAVRKWFPNPRPGFQNFAEAFAAADAAAPDAANGLVAVVRDAGLSAIARASALARLQRYLSRATLPVIAGALTDADDQVRLAALGALSAIDPAMRAHYLAPLLSDARRVIRIEAARALAGPAESRLNPADRAAFAKALRELLAAAAFNADRPEAHVQLGDLHAARTEAESAEREYRQALKHDPSFVPAWANFAVYLNATGKRDEATQLLRDGLKANPQSAELQHALGLALIHGGDRKAALGYLGAATKGAPENPRFAFVHAVAQHDGGDRSGALKTLQAALKRHPYDRDLLLALDDYRRESRFARKP